MQIVSENYKNHFENNFALSPKTKIVIDGVEYLGNVIKTPPKFSHSNTTYIGGFPTKSVNFEILNSNNDIDFEGKELEIYKGLYIDGETIYVKQGIFIPQASDIENNISTKTIKFKNVSDKTQFLNDLYETNLNWSVKHSGLEIIQEICNKKQLTLESSDFPFADYLFNQPNFPSKTTYREVISRLAELGGAIAIFNNNGNLEIKTQNITNNTISRKRYKKLSREKMFSPNLLVIGNEGYDNDIVYPNPKPNEVIEYRIEDNPFIDLNREEMIETVASYILSTSYIPFEIEDFIDSYNYELNDVLSVTDKNGATFNAVILDISNTSRIKTKLSAPVKEKTISNYSLAGSMKKELSEVSFKVDHNEKRIEGVAKDVNNNTKKISKIELDVGSITQTVNKTEETVNTAVEKFRVNLDTNNIVISVNGENKPHTTTNYDINYNVFFMGKKITCKPITEDSKTGITLTIENNYIRFSVNKDTQIAALDNKYTFKFSYTDTDNNTYELYKSIIVCLALQGNDGADGQNGQDGADGKDGKESAIQSNTAPEDTSLMWLDTTTNQLKRYNGETWEIINDFSHEIDSINSSINDLDASVQDKLTNLENMVNRVITEFETKYTQTNNSFSWEINQTLKQIKDKTDELEEKVIQQTDYMRFEADVGLIIGKSTDRYTLVSKNNGIEVRFNNIPVSFWEGDTFKVTRLMLGNFAFTPRDNGSLDFGKVVN